MPKTEKKIYKKIVTKKYLETKNEPTANLNNMDPFSKIQELFSGNSSTITNIALKLQVK